MEESREKRVEPHAAGEFKLWGDCNNPTTGNTMISSMRVNAFGKREAYAVRSDISIGTSLGTNHSHEGARSKKNGSILLSSSIPPITLASRSKFRWRR